MQRFSADHHAGWAILAARACAAFCAALAGCTSAEAPNQAADAGPASVGDVAPDAQVGLDQSLGDEITSAPTDSIGDEGGPQDVLSDAPSDLGEPVDAPGVDGGCTQTGAWCQSNDTVAKCKEGALQLLPCGPFQLCLSGGCAVQVCVPSSTQCEGKKIVHCDDTGTVASVLQDCASQDMICEGAACKPALCPGGTKKCDGQVAMACSPGGTAWLKLADCGADQAVCHEGSCIPIPCKDGGTGCVGGQAVACTGASWSMIADCKAAGQVCSGGGCLQAACKPGDFDCMGGLAVACESPGLVWSPPLACPPTTQCTAGIGCTKGPCMADETGCEGSQPVACDGAGLPTPTGDDCAGSGMVCSGGMCAAKVCTPGVASCQSNVRVICADSGAKWLPQEDCGAQVCDAGLCVPKTCGEGQTACAGGQVAVCDGAWKLVSCPSGSLCSWGACTEPQCEVTAPKGPVLVVQSLPLAKLADACDLDGNGTKDQALGGLSQISQGSSSAQAALGLVRILQPLGTGPDAVALLPAAVTPTSSWASCPGATCQVGVAPDAYELGAVGGICPAKSILDPVVLGADKLSAGGPGTAVWIPLQLGALVIEVPLLGARLKATTTGPVGAWTQVSGVLCGAIPQSQLLGSIEALPDAALGSAANKLALQKLLAGLAPPDLDLDGDGKPDALSAAFTLESGPAQSLGISP